MVHTLFLTNSQKFDSAKIPSIRYFITTVMSCTSSVDITVVTQHDTKLLIHENGKKVKCLLSECHLDKGKITETKSVSKESLGSNSGVVWKWENYYSTEISLLLRLGVVCSIVGN